MIRSLKTRSGLASACLSVLALVAGLLVARPLIYRHQLAEVDENLARNADELWRDMGASWPDEEDAGLAGKAGSEDPNRKEPAKSDKETSNGAAPGKPSQPPIKGLPKTGDKKSSATAGRTNSEKPQQRRPKAPDPRKPLDPQYIPRTLSGRYFQIHGLDGAVTSSRNLRGYVMHGEPGQMETVVIEGRNCRVGTFENGLWTAHIGIRLGSLENTQEDLLIALLRIAPGLGFVVFCIGWWLGNHALRPVSTLTAAAEKIDASAPDARLPLLDTSEEIVRLTEVLNSSFDRLQAAYTSAARFSADASHQLKTPIAVLRASLDNLRAQPSLAPEVRTEVDALLKQTRRLTTLTEDLLLLAQMDAGRLQLETEPFDLAALSRAVLDDLEVLALSRNLTVEHEIPETLPAQGDPRRTALILQNLTENAAKYAGESGCIRITASHSGDSVRVSVANTGPGIPEEHRARLFERFYRAGTGENISGHGLGLNIARGLALAQKGDLQLVRSDGEWTEFCVTLPAPAPVPVENG